MADKAYGDKVAQSLAASQMSWFDSATAQLTVNECVAFSRKLLKELTNDDLSEVKPKDKSQMLAYLAKLTDQIARLTQFSQGAADSRQELTLSSILPHLSDEEMAMFDNAIARMEFAKAAQDIGATTKSALH